MQERIASRPFRVRCHGLYCWTDDPPCEAYIPTNGPGDDDRCVLYDTDLSYDAEGAPLRTAACLRAMGSCVTRNPCPLCFRDRYGRF